MNAREKDKKNCFTLECFVKSSLAPTSMSCVLCAPVRQTLPKALFVNIVREVEVMAFSWKTGSKTGILNSIWLEGHIGVLKSLRAALGLKKLMRTA